MGSLLQFGAILAQQNRLDDLFVHFRQRSNRVDTQYVLTGLAVLTAIIIAVWVLSQATGPKDRRRPHDSPGLLFYTLCKAHGLSWPQRWLLWRVARWHGLRDPARVFLEPDRLGVQGLGPALAAKAPQLEALRAKLYAGLEDAACAGAAPMVAGDGGEGAPGPVFPLAQAPALDLPPWKGLGRKGRGPG